MSTEKGTINFQLLDNLESQEWQHSSRPGRLFSRLEDGRIQCHLSPRQCKMKEGQPGFCRVRVNKGGELHTLNYGKSVNVTEESIETEAVFHYMPGARILSLGNIGCMMNCDYCHNWKTSQARFVQDEEINEYTSEQIVTIAEERNIPVLSWTYNDPVVWHEFVVDTSRLAHERGLVNLYKSAFFISLEGAAELCKSIDIFSVSIKTMDEELYRKISKGWLPPVLEATKYVFDQGKHVEVSNLMVTDANDSEDDAATIAKWVLTHLSAETPVHFVRFHPDYKYTHVGRTPIERLVRARKVAMEMGIKYCYLGNVYDNEGTNTFCHHCGSLLIERFGLNTWIRGLTADGCCQQCGTDLLLIGLATDAQTPQVGEQAEIIPTETLEERSYNWRGDVNACHVEMINTTAETQAIYYWRMNGNGTGVGPIRSHVHAGDRYRFILSKSSPNETGVRIQYPDQIKLKLYEVFDRAHYPTVDVDTAQGESDSIPALQYVRRGGQSPQPS